MKTAKDDLNVKELSSQKRELEDRIKRIEADIKCPLEASFSEQAPQLTNQILLKRLLEVERQNLRKVNIELEKKKQSGRGPEA